MKRFAPLALVVLALAAVPAALADDGSTPAPTAPAAAAPTLRQAGVGTRLEILRLRLRIVQLRFALHCGAGGNGPSDRCGAFAQKVELRLQTLDGKVQKKIDELQSCSSTSTDPTCKNADKKLALLRKVDAHLQAVIQKLQDWLNGKGATAPSSDSALDQAANDLGQLAGSDA